MFNDLSRNLGVLKRSESPAPCIGSLSDFAFPLEMKYALSSLGPLLRRTPFATIFTLSVIRPWDQSHLGDSSINLQEGVGTIFETIFCMLRDQTKLNI